MPRPVFLLPAMLFLSWVLASCNETRTMRCARGVLPLSFVGFSIAELDSVYVLQYAGGGNFTGAADTVLYVSDSGTFISSGDTLTPQLYNDFPVMHAGFDYEIRIPASGKASRVTGIALEGQEYMTYRAPAFSKVDMDPCFNSVMSYIIDGRQSARTLPEYEPFYATVVR